MPHSQDLADKRISVIYCRELTSEAAEVDKSQGL